MNRVFEGTCTCGTRITGDTRTWRHVEKPAKPHQAGPTGAIKEL